MSKNGLSICTLCPAWSSSSIWRRYWSPHLCCCLVAKISAVDQQVQQPKNRKTLHREKDTEFPPRQIRSLETSGDVPLSSSYSVVRSIWSPSRSCVARSHILNHKSVHKLNQLKSPVYWTVRYGSLKRRSTLLGHFTYFLLHQQAVESARVPVPMFIQEEAKRSQQQQQQRRRTCCCRFWCFWCPFLCFSFCFASFFG